MRTEINLSDVFAGAARDFGHRHRFSACRSIHQRDCYTASRLRFWRLPFSILNKKDLANTKAKPSPFVELSTGLLPSHPPVAVYGRRPELGHHHPGTQNEDFLLLFSATHGLHHAALHFVLMRCGTSRLSNQTWPSTSNRKYGVFNGRGVFGRKQRELSGSFLHRYGIDFGGRVSETVLKYAIRKTGFKKGRRPEAVGNRNPYSTLLLLPTSPIG